MILTMEMRGLRYYKGVIIRSLPDIGIIYLNKLLWDQIEKKKKYI